MSVYRDLGVSAVIARDGPEAALGAATASGTIGSEETAARCTSQYDV
jgi:hypothetical protein